MSPPSTSGVLDLTVTDVRQHAYCPRIPFFRLAALLRPRVVTAAMQEGTREHQRTADLEHRRGLRAYGLEDGERLFNVTIRCARLALSGRLDLVIRREHEVIPVEFKNSTAPLGLNQKYQLTAYAMLAEEHFQLPARRGFVYFIPRKAAREVAITPATRAYTRRILREIREGVRTEHMPAGTRVLGRCHACEFLRYCNDRW